jgi:hypothetical protein
LQNRLLRARRSAALLNGLAVLHGRLDMFAKKFKNAATSSIEPASTGEKSVNGENSGVSFLITQAQKSKLRELGIADEQIRDLKPDDAHLLLGLAG